MQEFSSNDSTITSAVSLIPEIARVRLVTAQKSEHTAPWFFHVAQGMPVFYVVACGQCRLWLDECDERFMLGTGDVAVLLRGKSHWLQYDQQTTGIPSGDVPRRTTIVRGRFTWNEDEFASYLPELLPVVHFRSENGQVASWIVRIVRMIADQADSNRHEAQAVINYLAYTILVESLHVGATGRSCCKTPGQVRRTDSGPARP